MPHPVIVADADACVPQRIRDDLGIITAPLDAPLVEGQPSVLELRRDFAPFPPQAIADACMRAAETSDAVLYFSVADPDAGGLAEDAARALGRRARFVHRDTGAVLMACGWQAVAAAVAARSGAGMEQACAAAGEVASRTQVLAMIEHPEMLNTPAGGWSWGGLRRRRAIFRLTSADFEVLERISRREEALETLRDRFADAARDGEGFLRVAVHHAGSEAAAEAMVLWTERALAPEEVVVAPLTRHAAGRFGPGMVAFAWYREPRS
jgi:fatty acid-binding protein DegV